LKKPLNPEEHKGLIENITKTNIKILENYYSRNIPSIKDQIQNSTFYKDLRDSIFEVDLDYQKIKKYSLIDRERSLILNTKSFDSMIEKCYRWDVLENVNWDTDYLVWSENYLWTHPLNCFSKIPDIVRTRITLRYIDGLDIVLKKLENLIEKHHYEKQIEYLASEAGYYGVHFDVKIPVKIVKINWTEENIILNFEIQITTQIKDVVNEILHEYYVNDRLGLIDYRNWQWNYSHKNFLPNYLGHVAHYLEGMVLQARDRLRSPST
jgi:hypothetical protein